MALSVKTMTDTSREKANYFLVCERGVNESVSEVACSQVLYKWLSQTIGASATLGNQIDPKMRGQVAVFIFYK